jgi:hypothetical protein
MMEQTMIDTQEQSVIADALAVIDKGLAEMLHRELVSTDEVADLLLDVRSLLAASDSETSNN